jgi:protoheme IX farnesyltransferase
MSASSPATSATTYASTRSRVFASVRDYVALTRPRVLMLVLFTAPAGMALGYEGWPEIHVLAGVVAGAALIGGGCGAINAWIERDRDAKMTRTQDRPLPTGRLTPQQALNFGLAISLLGLVALYAVGGWLPAAVGLVTLLHYIFVYTLWLKPRSPQSIVIGGAAGAASPLIADAAANGSLGIWSVVLFAIVFLWTPPHFWAIALYRKQEYEAAGFPMMPSVVGDAATRRKSLVYAILLLPVTLLPWIGGQLGSLYALTAVLGAAYFIYQIVQSMRMGTREKDREVFLSSIIYLTLLFGAMLVELAIR